MSGSEEDINMSGNEDEVKQEPQNTSDGEEIDEEDIIKILIATDIHLGYEQTIKRVQEDDSFRTFEEILQYAKEYEVDMILLGGDLFHEAKPPHNVVMECINLLRTYCLSDKPVKIQLLTDPEIVFSHCSHKTVNYEDPNLNVGIPLFSIHGNHDDPSFGAVGSIDVLSATGFINYFGKWTDVTQVSIAPLLIRKGATTVSLYGLSYMNDQRLSRLMRTGKFEMLQANDIEDPFNIFVLHQNRAQHSQNSFIPEDKLPEFLHLVIWGHEHECLIIPEKSKSNPQIHICQPGSSVATSLAQGEAAPKHVGILSVYKNQYKMKTLKLKTVRPFVFEDIVLNDYNDEITTFKSRPEAVEEFIDNYIENILIPQAAEQQTNHPKQPEKPLIRLRIFYSEDRDVFDTLTLSQKYYHVAANPNDMILFRKCSSKLKKQDIRVEQQDFGEIGEIFRFDEGSKDWSRTVQGGMTEYFSQNDQINKLTVLSLNGLNEALARFVNANDTKAFHDLVKHQMKKTVDHLIKNNYKDKKEVLEAIKNYRDERLEKQKEEQAEEESFFNTRNNTTSKTATNNASSRNEDNDNEDMASSDGVDDEPAPTRGRGRGRGSGRAAANTKDTTSSSAKRSRGRATKNKTAALDITTSGRSNKSLLSWKKPSQSSQSANKQSNVRPIIIDSDSD